MTMNVLRGKMLAWAALVLVAVVPVIAAQIPRKAPELVIGMPDGKDKLLSSYRGKVVALEVMLTTCPHCQTTARMMTKLHQELGPRGFQPISVAIDPMGKMLVTDFAKQFQVSYPVGYLDRDVAVNFLQHPVMMRMLVPYLVFIDREGNIRAQYPGGDDFFREEEKNVRDMVNKLLNEGSSKSAPKKARAKKSS
jgi:thiol-disulfide isomerase/thioredoxin